VAATGVTTSTGGLLPPGLSAPSGGAVPVGQLTGTAESQTIQALSPGRPATLAELPGGQTQYMTAQQLMAARFDPQSLLPFGRRLYGLGASTDSNQRDDRGNIRRSTAMRDGRSSGSSEEAEFPFPDDTEAATPAAPEAGQQPAGGQDEPGNSSNSREP